jgi:hypothetical protein
MSIKRRKGERGKEVERQAAATSNVDVGVKQTR